MKLIRKENGDYHLLINGEIKSLQDFNIIKEDCDILTLGYSVEKMAFKDWNNQSMDYKDISEYQDFSFGFHRGLKSHRELTKDKLFFDESNLLLLLTFVARTYFNKGKESYKHNMAIDGDPLFGLRKELKSYIKPHLPKTQWKVKLNEQGKLEVI